MRNIGQREYDELVTKLASEIAENAIYEMEKEASVKSKLVGAARHVGGKVSGAGKYVGGKARDGYRGAMKPGKELAQDIRDRKTIKGLGGSASAQNKKVLKSLGKAGLAYGVPAGAAAGGAAYGMRRGKAEKTAESIELLFGKEAAENFLDLAYGDFEKVAYETEETIFEKVASYNDIELDEAIEVIAEIAEAFEDAQMRKIAAEEVYEESLADEDYIAETLDAIGFEV